MTDNTAAPIKEQCCKRDHNRDGNCDIHSAPGVLRNPAFRTSNTVASSMRQLARLQRAHRRLTDIASTEALEAGAAEIDRLNAALGARTPTETYALTEADVHQFIGWLSGDIAELHTVEVPRLQNSWNQFKATRAIIERGPCAEKVSASRYTVKRHGVDCPKEPHLDQRAGYLHGPDDDGPYDVDGVMYCGRCHGWIDTIGRAAENGFGKQE